MVYAFIASAALHLGAMYGASRVMSATRSASMPSVEFRTGDHAIEIRLIPTELPEQVVAGAVAAQKLVEKPVMDAPIEPGKIEADVEVNNDAAGSMIQDAASARTAAAETGQRIVQIVVVEARKAVGRLKDMLDSASQPDIAVERVTTRPIAKPIVVPAKTPPPKTPPPKTVPPVVVKPPEIELSPKPTRAPEVVHDGETPAPDEPAPPGRSGVTHGASLLDLPTPHYPLTSRRRGEEGLITLRVRVLADGRVGAVEIVSGPRFERLRRAALGAARRARFSPAVRSGKAIASTVIVPIRFMLR